MLNMAKGYKSETPIFAFHLASATEGQALTKNYEIFALDIVGLLRNVEMNVASRLEKVARLMRYFICAKPVGPIPFNADTVKLAITNIAREKDWADKSTRSQWEKFADEMFGALKDPVARTGGYHRDANRTYFHVDQVYVYDEDDDKHDSGRRGLRLENKFALPKKAALEGEGLDDYPTRENILTSGSPFADARRHFDIPLSVLNFQQYNFFWDRRSPKLYEIARLIELLPRLCAQEETSWIPERRIAFFVGRKLFP